MRTETIQSMALLIGLSLVTYGVGGWSKQAACIVLGALLLAGVVWTRITGTETRE